MDWFCWLADKRTTPFRQAIPVQLLPERQSVIGCCPGDMESGLWYWPDYWPFPGFMWGFITQAMCWAGL